MRPHEDYSGAGAVIAVIGGCGGAGGSSFAAALAAVSARSGPTCLMDLDNCGGGIDALLGTEDVVGPRWSDVTVDSGYISPETLMEALPRWGDVAYLSSDGHEVTDSQIVPVLLSARMLTTTVLDLPRWTSDDHIAWSEATLGVMVVPAEVRAVAAASRVLTRLTAGGVPGDLEMVLVVRGASRRLPASVVADALKLPLAGVLPFDAAMNDPAGFDASRLRRATVEVAGSVLREAQGICVEQEDAEHADGYDDFDFEDEFDLDFDEAED